MSTTSQQDGMIPADTDVIIQNLQSQPQYNGLEGRVLQFHSDKGRYAVRLHDTDEVLLIKPNCIQEIRRDQGYFDRERSQRLQRERQAAQAILDDPNRDQLARDLAHLRLQHDDQATAYGEATKYPSTASDLPEEWMTVEANENGLVSLSDKELIALVEDPLLRNKCKTIRCVPQPNGGKPSVIQAYPKLARAAKNLLNHHDPQVVASANAVMACLVRANKREKAIMYFQKAIRNRPEDWRLRNALASSYMALQKTSLALEALTQAVNLTPEDSFERFDVQESRGKVLYNLGRLDEAKECLLQVVKDLDKYKDRMTPRDYGHTVAVEYFLCAIYAKERNKKKVKQYWDSAEAKRNALSPQVHQSVDWDSRLNAQELMAGLDPNLLTHQECHHCRQLVPNPKVCPNCRAAIYCSRPCQVAAWKAGHKQQCQQAKETRKEQKKEQKKTVKKIQAVKNLPPLDATLDPYALWAKAKKLANTNAENKPLDAVFYFTVALFLDFSLDAQDMGPARAAVEASPPDHPLSLALGMLTHMDKSNPLPHLERNRLKATEYFSTSSVEYDTSETLEQVDRAKFGLDMCFIFQARVMAKVFRVTSFEQSRDAAHKQAFDDILTLINGIEMDSDRWLTLQFERGYTNLDVGAADEGKRWLELFVTNLGALEKKNGKLTKHWKSMRKRAREKLKMVPMVQQYSHLA